MTILSNITGEANRSTELLIKIALALDRPIEAFLEPLPDHDQTAELLRLWIKIECDKTRIQVLKLIRTIAGETALDLNL